MKIFINSSYQLQIGNQVRFGEIKDVVFSLKRASDKEGNFSPYEEMNCRTIYSAPGCFTIEQQRLSMKNWAVNN